MIIHCFHLKFAKCDNNSSKELSDKLIKRAEDFTSSRTDLSDVKCRGQVVFVVILLTYLTQGDSSDMMALNPPLNPQYVTGPPVILSNLDTSEAGSILKIKRRRNLSFIDSPAFW